MNTLEKSIKSIKDVLSSEDVLVFEFASDAGKKFAVIYADGLIDKQLLGELVIKPLRVVEKDASLQDVEFALASPEFKTGNKKKDAVKEILNGNAVLLIDGEKEFFIAGVKSPPARAVAEPPTQVAVHGPREGFIEDKPGLAGGGGGQALLPREGLRLRDSPERPPLRGSQPRPAHYGL